MKHAVHSNVAMMTHPSPGTPRTCPLVETPEVCSQHPTEDVQAHHPRTPTAAPSLNVTSSLSPYAHKQRSSTEFHAEGNQYSSIKVKNMQSIPPVLLYAAAAAAITVATFGLYLPTYIFRNYSSGNYARSERGRR